MPRWRSARDAARATSRPAGDAGRMPPPSPCETERWRSSRQLLAGRLLLRKVDVDVLPGEAERRRVPAEQPWLRERVADRIALAHDRHVVPDDVGHPPR